MTKKSAKWIVAMTAAWGLNLSSFAPAQETPAPAEAPAPAEEPAAPEAPAPEPTEPPAPEAPAPEPTETPAPETPAPDAPVPDAPAPEAPAPAPADAPAPAPADKPADVPPGEEGQPQLDPQLVTAGQIVLSERFAEIAQATLREGNLDEMAFRRARVLLRAATTLSPNDYRCWQLLTEAELRSGDSSAVMAALTGFRKSAPGFAVPQIQFIELAASQIEAVEKQLDYLKKIAVKETVAPEVRAHAHVMVAELQIERGEDKAAVESLDAALQLNPVNLAALDMKYQYAAANGGPLDRATALLGVIRGNPVRADALGAFGRLLADVGLHKDAADWMNRAIKIAPDAQTHHALAIDAAAQLYIAGQIQPARIIVDSMIQNSPDDIDAWVLKLVMDRNDKDAYAKTLERAGAVVAKRWDTAAKVVKEGPAAATQPADPAAPAGPPADPAAVAKEVAAANDPQKFAAFQTAATDYAWFELYFKEDAGAAAKWTAALESVLPEDSLARQRLRGWTQLIGKQPEDAKQTLGAIRESDPLAALGAIRVGAANADKEAQKVLDDEARKLLEDYRAGLVGAIVTQGLKDRGLTPAPHPDAPAIKSLLGKFPRGWLDIADQPQRFYTIRVDPLRIAHRFSEPIYVRVTLQNLSNQDITIGEGGVIKPDLWFDAQCQVFLQPEPMVSGVAIERIMQTTVLPAQRAISMYVRLDQGKLAQAISSTPTPRIQITGWCFTNLVPRGDGYGPGPAGAKVPFTKKISRVGFQVGSPKIVEKLLEEVKQGLPEMKIRTLNLVSAYVPIAAKDAQQLAQETPQELAEADLDKRHQMAAQRKEMAASRQKLVQSFAGVLNEMTADEVPAVAQWAKLEMSRYGDPAQKLASVESLLADPRWEGRMLGLIAAPNLGREAATVVISKVAENSEEKDPLVKQYAIDLVETIKNLPATTQPAAAPEGAPAEAPASK